MLPPLPFEIQREIILAGVDHHRYIHLEDSIPDIIEGKRLLSRACLVSKDWKDIALPLLYRDVAFLDPEEYDRSCHLFQCFLRTISSSPPLALLVESFQTGPPSFDSRVTQTLGRYLRHLSSLKTLSRALSSINKGWYPKVDGALAPRLRSLTVDFENWVPFERSIMVEAGLDLSELRSLTIYLKSTRPGFQLSDPDIDPFARHPHAARGSCFHPPVEYGMVRSRTGRHRMGVIDDLRIYGTDYHQPTFSSLIAAVGPHLRTLHLAFAYYQKDVSSLPSILTSFPNLTQFSLDPILDPLDHTNFLLFSNSTDVASSLQLLLIGSPVAVYPRTYSHLEVVVCAYSIQDIFDSPNAQLPALKAVGFWELSFQRTEDRGSSDVAEAAGVLEGLGIELRDRLGVVWRQEWEESY